MICDKELKSVRHAFSSVLGGVVGTHLLLKKMNVIEDQHVSWCNTLSIFWSFRIYNLITRKDIYYLKKVVF